MTAVPGTLDIPGTRAHLYALRDQLPMFVMYDHPSDHPDFYVARLHLTFPEPQPTGLAILDRDLERLQETMEALGLVKLMRQPGDDPVILETWI
jgi:hypothetical protein